MYLATQGGQSKYSHLSLFLQNQSNLRQFKHGFKECPQSENDSSIRFSPWRIIDDCGGAFTMGLIGGSLFNLINGARHAPSGWSRRAVGGLTRMKERAPVLGGQGPML